MNDVKITYVNHSGNQDNPTVFLFTKNEVPTFDVLRDGVAWRTFERIGRGSSATAVFPINTEVSASWDGGCCRTALLTASIGGSYTVAKDSTGIVLTKEGNAGNTRSIDVVNGVQVDGGICVNLYKDGHIMMTKQIVAYDQKATFVLHPKLYWGLASEIQEGELLNSAVLDSASFYELDLEGLTEVTVGLYGNAQDGYEFRVDSKR